MHSTSAGNLIRKLGLQPVVRLDTAGAAAEIAEAGDRTQAVIASELAGDIYGLVSLRGDIEDARHNTTRFLIMAKEPVVPHPKSAPSMTSFVFRVRNVPAALYKALGGFRHERRQHDKARKLSCRRPV